MKPSNQNKTPDTVARAATCPATVGEVVRLVYQYSRCVEDSVEDKLLFQQRIEECVSSLIEQLRITNHRYYEEEDERREGFNTAAEMTNSKIDDMLK